MPINTINTINALVTHMTLITSQKGTLEGCVVVYLLKTKIKTY
jgi:hypothetical protein